MGIFTECARCDELKAEIKQLENANQDLVDERDIFKRTLDKRDAELERLREEILNAHEEIARKHAQQQVQDVEIDRLRGLLREAEKMWPNPGLSSESASWYRRVREALGE